MPLVTRRKTSRTNAELRPTGDGRGTGPDNYDGRANTAAGTKGKEPGGRWGPAYYESKPVVITKYHKD